MKRFTRQKPGDPVSAKIINAPMDAIEANQLSFAGAGIGACRTRSGIALYDTRHQPTVIGKTTSSIGKRRVDAPGYGSFVFQKFDGSSLADVTSSTFIAYNIFDQDISSGHYVFLNWWGGYWWVVAVDSCSATSSSASSSATEFLSTVSATSLPPFDAGSYGEDESETLDPTFSFAAGAVT